LSGAALVCASAVGTSISNAVETTEPASTDADLWIETDMMNSFEMD
jgi:hypothetical protein